MTPKRRKKQALGRGLSALIPDLEAGEVKDSDYLQCDIDRIRPNRYQPRRHFSEGELEELAQSIREQGVLQPLLVRRDGEGFELIAGERRLRAAKRAGLKRIPVLVKSLEDRQVIEISLIENIQREDLNPLETADAYHQLITEFELTQDQVADRVGKSRSAVANFIRLRGLPEPVKDSIRKGAISMGHARALLGAQTPAKQLAAWRAVTGRGLSVRQTEQLVSRLKGEPRTPSRKKSSANAYLTDLADNLSRKFGTRVIIHRRGKRGKVEIEFYGDADLDRVLELLGGD